MTVALELAPIPQAPPEEPPLVSAVRKQIAAGADAVALTTLYLKVRAAKGEIETQAKNKLAPINTSLDLLEAHFLEVMQAAGTDSLKNKAGTPYMTKKISVKSEDNEAFVDYVLTQSLAELAVSDKAKEAIKKVIIDSGQLAFIEVRPSKSAVEAHLEATKVLVPGIARRVENAVNVRTN